MQVFTRLLILPPPLHSPQAIHVAPPNISAIWCARSRFVHCEKRSPVLQEVNSMSTHHISVTINGTSYEEDVDSRTLLVHWIRDTLRLTGTHIGCDTTSCGACTILVDGKATKSCTMFAVQADGRQLMTVEGLEQNDKIHPLQEGFHEEHALQCGYCTPGMMMTSLALLQRITNPTEHEIRVGISGNLCRCTGYVNIVKAILDAAGLAWMPTLSANTEAVLALDRVHFQMQEVAFVVATNRYAAADGAAAVEVDYEPLQVVVDPKKALEPDAPLLRPDKKDKQPTNQIYHWETGERTETDADFAEAEASGVVVKQDMFIPRIHPAPIETCGCVADYNKTTGKLTVWLTSQAPHAHRTLFAIVAGLPEHRIRIISPDIGGGFGNKVPIYPGYVCAVVASLTTGKHVKWIEDRSENIGSTGFARDYHIHAEIAADKDGNVKALKVHTLADHGAFDAAAQPTKFPAGLFHICTGSYDFKHAFVDVDAVHTNKAPGGIAYRCSFRVTEASYLIERMMDTLAHDLGKDPAQLRLQNFIKPEAFPYRSALDC